MISHWYECHCSFLYCCSLDKDVAIADATRWLETEQALNNDAEIELVPIAITDEFYNNLNKCKELQKNMPTTLYVNFIVEYLNPMEDEIISFELDVNNEEHSRGCKLV